MDLQPYAEKNLSKRQFIFIPKYYVKLYGNIWPTNFGTEATCYEIRKNDTKLLDYIIEYLGLIGLSKDPSGYPTG